MVDLQVLGSREEISIGMKIGGSVELGSCTTRDIVSALYWTMMLLKSDLFRFSSVVVGKHFELNFFNR